MSTPRHLLATQPYVFAPLCYNPLGARLAQEVGCQAVYLSGGSYGATLTWTEAMLTVTELADLTHRCATTIDIPVIVDGAGEGGRETAQAILRPEQTEPSGQSAESLFKNHTIAFAPEEVETLGQQLNTTIGLPGYCELERRTVEKDATPCTVKMLAACNMHCAPLL